MTAEHAARHLHEAGFYSSDDEFLTFIVPFVDEGTDAGDRVLLGYDDHKAHLVRASVRDPEAITFIANTDLYARPARAIECYRRMFKRSVADGADRIRIAGNVPHASDARQFAGWDRYEWAVNTVWDDYPVNSLCLYDASTVSPEVRDIVERTHPWLRSSTGKRRSNTRYRATSVFEPLPVAPDPLESTTPLVELHGAQPREARDALRQLAHGRLDDAAHSDLELATSEAVTNALVHGEPPTTVRMWAASDRVVVHVNDHGRGPVSPLAGLVRSTTMSGTGIGLWLTHQLDLDVDLQRGNGFTVRLRGTRRR